MPSSPFLDLWRRSSCVSGPESASSRWRVRDCDDHCGVFAAVRPYTEEKYQDETMTVFQVPIFGEFRRFPSPSEAPLTLADPLPVEGKTPPPAWKQQHPL